MALQIPDQTIAAKGDTSQSLTTLGNVANIANSVQNLKNSQLANKVTQRSYDTETSLRDIASSPEMYNPDGSFNSDKYAAKAAAFGGQGNESAAGALGNTNRSTANHQTQYNLTNGQMNDMMGKVGGLLQDKHVQAAMDPNVMANPAQAATVKDGQVSAISTLEDQLTASGVPKNAVKLAMSPLYSAAAHNPAALPGLIKQITASQIGAAGQVAAGNPSYVNTGGALQNTNQFSTGQPQIDNTLPPTTQRFNPTTNQMEYIGSATGAPAAPAGPQGLDLSKLSPQDQAALARANPQAFANGAAHFQQTQGQGGQPQQATPSGGVAASPPMGAESSTAGSVATINKHWEDISKSGAGEGPANRISILQDIKAHADGAATGVFAERQGLAAGIAGLIGIDPGQAAKTSTDILAKDTALLAAAGGDTDLARNMAMMANPNIHMTKEAISQVSDRLIAVEKMRQKQYQFMQPFKAMADQGHPEMYQKAMAEWSQIADPRILQISSMSDKDIAAMKSKMSPDEQQGFKQKMLKAKSMGIM